MTAIEEADMIEQYKKAYQDTKPLIEARNRMQEAIIRAYIAKLARRKIERGIQ
jgi:hypothetical protein